MTKDFSFFFLFSSFLFLLPSTMLGETIDNFVYSLNNSDHTAKLLKPAVALTGDVTLPTRVTHNGATYNVTAIDGGNNYRGYFFGQQLTSLTVPEGYLSIGDYAFSDCAQLASVALPNSLQSVGNGAFYACTSLSSVTLSEATTVVYGAFGRCPKRRMVKIRCADVPTSAEQKTWNDNTDNRVLFVVPAFAWSVSVANNSVVDAGGQLRFAQNTNGLEVKYTATVGGVAGSEQRGTIYTFPSATTAPQTVNIVAEAVGGTNIVVEGGTTLTLQYTLRGQVPFTLDLGGGVKAPEASLTLPAKTTDYNVPVTYKVGTQRKTGTYKFPKATTEAQSITIVAQATAPANCTISGESSKSFEFLVKGERSYAWEPSYADGQDVPAGYEMQLPATVSDQGLLNVAYTMNGQAVTGTTFPFPTAQASKQEFDLVATPSLPDDLQNVALTNPAAKTYHYTVRGRAPFVPNLLSQDIAPEKNLTLDATTDNGLNVTYTVNGTTTEGSFKMPKASTDPADVHDRGHGHRSQRQGGHRGRGHPELHLPRARPAEHPRGHPATGGAPGGGDRDNPAHKHRQRPDLDLPGGRHPAVRWHVQGALGGRQLPRAHDNGDGRGPRGSGRVAAERELQVHGAWSASLHRRPARLGTGGPRLRARPAQDGQRRLAHRRPYRQW